MGQDAPRLRGVDWKGYWSRHRWDNGSSHTRKQEEYLARTQCLEKDSRKINKYAQQWQTDMRTIFAIWKM